MSLLEIFQEWPDKAGNDDHGRGDVGDVPASHHAVLKAAGYSVHGYTGSGDAAKTVYKQSNFKSSEVRVSSNGGWSEHKDATSNSRGFGGDSKSLATHLTSIK